jgi:methanogenic corrinoid protein MtbC1
MSREVLMERFFNTLIGGNRPAARQIVDQVLEADTSAERVIVRLFWPTLEHIQKLHRADQLSDIAHHYAVRTLRSLADQMQLRLEQSERQDRKVLLICGPNEPEELAAQMGADMLEAKGFDVYFAGGGIANDEIVAQVGELNADVLCVFGASASIVPFTRQLIDRLHETGVCPKLQIAVGGGVFNRAEGLAEEIGADVWALDPEELVQAMIGQPGKRMAQDQRTVGRKRRGKRDAA